MDAVRQYNAQLLPVDSEHNAIFQTLPETLQQQLGYGDLTQNGVESIILTGSGGPFRDCALHDLAEKPQMKHALIQIGPWVGRFRSIPQP